MSEFRHSLEISSILPSPDNPREDMDVAELNELAETIKLHGVLQPILVRPLRPIRKGKSKGPTYELVAGERRWRAAQIAGLVNIPAVIEEMTDLEAAEKQVIENEQRADLSPLEKAAGYKKLIDRHQVDVAALAAKVGKSPATIYGLLKLLELPAGARAALVKGELPATTAQLIGRIPNKELREKAFEDFRNESFNDQPISFREMEEIIRRNYMVELKGAPFNQEDADLTEAGPCSRCPKKTGNNRIAFPEGRADMCTDPACFKEKREAHAAAMLVKAKAEGKIVLAKGDASKLFETYAPTKIRSSSEWIDLKDQYFAPNGDRQNHAKSWKKLVGDKLKEETVLVQDQEGDLHELVPKKMALELVGDKAGSRAAAAAAQDPWQKKEAAKRKKLLKDHAAAKILVAEVVQEAERRAAQITFPKPLLDILPMIAAGLVQEIWHDNKNRICQRRGLFDDKKKASKGADELLQAYCQGITGLGFFGLVAEIVAWRLLHLGTYELPPKAQKPFLAAFNLAPKTGKADTVPGDWPER